MSHIRAYDTQNLTDLKQWNDVNDDYERRRKDMRISNMNVQKQQAAEKANRDALDSLIGDDLGKQHVNNCLKDDFYTENTGTCTSSIAPHRVLKYHWKGMNAEQVGQIRLDQQRQIDDKKMREAADKEEEKMWAEQEEANRRNLIRVQREHDRAKNARVLDEVVEYNRLKAKECERRDKIIYDNVHNYKVF